MKIGSSPSHIAGNGGPTPPAPSAPPPSSGSARSAAVLPADSSRASATGRSSPQAPADGKSLGSRQSSVLNTAPASAASAASSAASAAQARSSPEACQALGEALRGSIWASEEADAAFAALCSQARAGNRSAIDQLLRSVDPAVGNLPSEAMAHAVSGALADIYGKFRTPGEIKQQIRDHCAARLGELMARYEATPRQGKAAAAPALRLKAQSLVELAITCRSKDSLVHRIGLKNPWAGVCQQLDPRARFDPSTPPEDMLQFDRYFRQEEVLLATRDLAGVPVREGVSVVGHHDRDMGRFKDLPVIGMRTSTAAFSQAGFFPADTKSGSASVTGQAKSALQEAAQRGKPVTMLLNLDNVHWTTLVVLPPADDKPGTQVRCFLFDSLQRDGSSRRIRDALAQSLADPQAYGGGKLELQLEVVGGSLQDDTPNACGALATLAAKAVDQRYGRSRNLDDIKPALVGFAEQFRGGDKAGRIEFITQTRAEMLVNLMVANA